MLFFKVVKKLAGTALKPDVELLFGVLGGGKISGESGALIKSQLDSIVKSLNYFFEGLEA